MGRTAAEEHERLLNLFWNRAELKKEFSDLKDDRNQLLDKIQEQENQTRRVADQLRSLESRLADPELGYQAIVYYQLRWMWDNAHMQLEQFAEELTRQQQERERRKQIMEFNQERQKRLAKLGQDIVAVKAESDEAKLVVAATEAELAGLAGFWNYFKRREVQSTLDEQRAMLAAVRERIEEMFDSRIKIESEPWPDYPGLGNDGKRVINVAVIALSQYLFLHFSDHDLGSLARAAQVKKLSDSNYGSKGDCEYLMQKIVKAVETMRADSDLAGKLRARVGFLRKQVAYKDDSDTVPLANSLSTLMSTIPGSGSEAVVAGVPMDVNVLADNYWNLQTILQR